VKWRLYWPNLELLLLHEGSILSSMPLDFFSFRDGDQSISDERILTFDSTSPMLDERKRSVMLTLAAGSYDRTKDYFLVARDAKTKTEAWRAPLHIDLAFSNDF
jgi:hypothetical protein